ncbi:hypothetical protein ACQKNC_00465 [Lysinibacillus sp. NPDC094177]|uniref:hypothetical protein n=1 Tax=Lysinibacillus sp. NPDC094177 TaxID=3390580 RepID=UPI003D020C2C
MQEIAKWSWFELLPLWFCYSDIFITMFDALPAILVLLSAMFEVLSAILVLLSAMFEVLSAILVLLSAMFEVLSAILVLSIQICNLCKIDLLGLNDKCC